MDGSVLPLELQNHILGQLLLDEDARVLLKLQLINKFWHELGEKHGTPIIDSRSYRL